MNIKQAMNIAAIAEITASETTMDHKQALSQIGNMNRAAISGGRVHSTQNSIIMPVSNGYHVVVSLAANDTYTVQQVFVRAGKASVKGEWTDVYADQVGEVAYKASCFA
jgi:uncharacterized protein YgiB involved in biofilm formation